MNRIVVIVCFLIALLALPLWLLLAGFSPGLLNNIHAAPLVQRLGAYGMMAVVWAIPVWVVFFLWRTILTWGAASATRSAMLMALPGVCLIAFVASVNFS